jgi:hypothetical protein
VEHAAEGVGWLGTVQASAIGHTLRNGLWLYPTVETLHVIGLALLVGAIVTFDLRVLRAGPGFDLEAWQRAVLPVARAGFVLAVAMGVLLFTVEATAYARNPVFLGKLVLIVLALGNVWLFHRLAAHGGVTPGVRGAAAFSLLLWLLVAVCGRMIAYV